MFRKCNLPSFFKIRTISCCLPAETPTSFASERRSRLLKCIVDLAVCCYAQLIQSWKMSDFISSSSRENAVRFHSYSTWRWTKVYIFRICLRVLQILPIFSKFSPILSAIIFTMLYPEVDECAG